MATNAGGDRGAPEDAAQSAVMVVSIWDQGPGRGFLARLTATTAEGARSVDVAGSPEDLVEKFRIWVTTTYPMQASGR
jgi:hypothetical protein